MSAAHRRLELALTVEGGPFEHTGTIIDTLNSENVKVTFFVNALAVPFSQSIRNAFHSGHLIGLQVTPCHYSSL
jgi:peptidoglycan/xylan/chitin deacetylase (PgdA/CDA1 family)